MGFPTAVEAALAGEGITSETVVLASAVSVDHAAILLMAPDWGMPDLVLCHREDDGWQEGGSGSGYTVWSLYEEPDVGVLVSWGEADEGVTAFAVSFYGITTEVPVTNGYYVWMVEGVRKRAWVIRRTSLLSPARNRISECRCATQVDEVVDGVDRSVSLIALGPDRAGRLWLGGTDRTRH